MSEQSLYNHHSHRLLWLGAISAALLGFTLLAARPADAAYEQVGNFSGTPGVLRESRQTWPEEFQMPGVGGMAVNYTGAGGVPAGTIYAVTTMDGLKPQVVRYNPDGSLSARWSFAGSPQPEQRCGPDGNPSEPTCKGVIHIVEVVAGNSAVSVDQTTGNVYVYAFSTQGPGAKVIHVYDAAGTELISEFGELAPSGRSFDESPSQIHAQNSHSNSGLTVNSEGVVYLHDESFPSAPGSPRQRRIMVFEPQSPGDYHHYVYAGREHDLGSEDGSGLTRLASDEAGHVYAVAGEEEGVVEFDPSQPGSPPVCTFKFPRNGIQSLTVNPVTGAAFFFTFKDQTHIHALSPCEAGKFSEAGTIPLGPRRTQIPALAFDPVRQFDASRPPGVLYAASPNGEGGNEEEGNSGENRSSETGIGYIFAQQGEVPPTVAGGSALHVTSTTAELKAEVNPESSVTRYVFQYETEAQYEANEPSDRFAGASEGPVGGGVAGEANNAVVVTAALSGLEPGTTYRYRVVASSHCSLALPEKLCEAAGEAHSFRTYPTLVPGLPDHRAYELVSPPDKLGGQVAPAEPLTSTCTETCKPGSSYAPYPMLSSPDGNTVVYAGSPFNSELAALKANEYISRRDPNGGWKTLDLSRSQQNAGSVRGYEAFDIGLGTAVVGQEGRALSADAPAEYMNLYVQRTDDPSTLTPLLGLGQTFHRPPFEGGGPFEINYAGASVDTSRVFFSANDALTEASADAPAAIDGGAEKFNLYEWHEGLLTLVNVYPGNVTQPGASFAPLGARAISEDGSRAFFSDGSGQVYVREQGEVTREIGDEGVPDPAKFVVASADGSLVLLANGHLHEVEEAEPTIDLTEGKGGFKGVAGETEDLSHIYFVDTEVLDGAANEHGEVAEAGKFNLYSWTRGEGPRFVAKLMASDNERGTDGFQKSRAGQARDWSNPPGRTAETSPNGRFLSFVTIAPLTGYDNVGPCEVSGSGPCQEAFVYDSVSGKLACASCDPSGEPPLGPSYLSWIHNASAQPRYLSDQGRLVFDSRDSILPADSNNGVEDVYEWEPEGVGGCESGFAEGGCVSLISAGTGSVDSNFLAMDPSGNNVFFTTRDQLKLKDKDELFDLYDARVDGGISSESEVARSECQGEACQPPVSAPNDPTPGTSSLEGAGNVKESKQKAKPKKHKAKKHKKRHQQKKRHAKVNHGGAK